MKNKTFEFKAFLFERYYKMWIVFSLLLILIIIIPGILLSNYFFPENTSNMSLISQLLILSLIAIPLMILLFFVINILFFRTLNISLGKKIVIKRNNQCLYEISPNQILKTVIRSNDNKRLKNRFRTLEIIKKEGNKVKIISRDKNQKGIFNEFLNSYVSYYNLDIDKAHKLSINNLGDYKLVFESNN